MPLSPVDIEAAFASLSVLENRTPTSSGPEYDAAFARLAETENGALFAAKFRGNSEWERHRNGDELVQIVDGHATVTVLVDGQENKFELSAGTFVVVPRGAWHRFEAPDGVQVMTMTPQPTDHWREDGLPPQVVEE